MDRPVNDIIDGLRLMFLDWKSSWGRYEANDQERNTNTLAAIRNNYEDGLMPD